MTQEYDDTKRIAKKIPNNLYFFLLKKRNTLKNLLFSSSIKASALFHLLNKNHKENDKYIIC